MRTILLALVAFVAGYGTALTTSKQPGEQAAQTAMQGERSQPAVNNSRSSGRERFQVGQDGHVLAVADIDGRSMEVLVDTGASTIMLRESDARRAGYRLQNSDFSTRINTANGQTYAAPIVLREVELGSIRVRDVPALVGRDHQLGVNLLGMTFLSRLDSFRFEGRELILEN